MPLSQDFKPNKRLGQNFLIDKNILKKIIETADLRPSDVVLEIGPGTGILTTELAKHAGRIVAVEKDKKLADMLVAANIKNTQIIHDDILKIKNLFKNYKIVANLPYYITAPVIRKFLEEDCPPEFMVLMVQKEVAQRICSKPPKMTLLSVSVQFYAEPKIISYVSKNCFWPAPKVDSAIIKITLKLGRGRVSTQLFFKIVKAGFSHPRKQLINNLSKSLKLTREQTETWLAKNNINPSQRAETLSIDDWKNLANSAE